MTEINLAQYYLKKSEIDATFNNVPSTSGISGAQVIKNAIDGKAGINHNHDGTYLKTHQDISGKENTSNKITSISSSSTDTQYPSAKLLYDKLETKANKVNGISQITDLNYVDYLNMHGGEFPVQLDWGTPQQTINSKINSRLGEKENSSNKVTSISSSSTNTEYPSAKLLYDQLATKANNNHTHSVNDIETGTFVELQELIEYADDGDTITLDKDYKYNWRTDSSLNSGILVTKNITIIGNGHIIDGDSYARAFLDMDGWFWELNDLKIQNCTDNSDNYGYVGGGAIYAAYSQLNINNTIFMRNDAIGSDGGAIYAESATVTIVNSTFTQNVADVNGGAIAGNSQIDISDTTFIKNNTENSYGGAIHNEYGTLRINNSNLIQNNAANGEGVGGAIYAAENSSLNIKESIIRDNDASSSANIYSDNATTVYNCEINNISTTCTNVTNKPYLTDQQTVDLIYPVGSIYMSVNSTSPATLFGGTWEQLENQFLLGAGSSYTAGATGGEATHTLTTNEMPSHTHTQNQHTHTQNGHSHNASQNSFVESNKALAIDGTLRAAPTASSGKYYWRSTSTGTGSIHQATASTTATNQNTTATNQNTGGGQAHNNMPPYLVVYMWKRTA